MEIKRLLTSGEMVFVFFSFFFFFLHLTKCLFRKDRFCSSSPAHVSSLHLCAHPPDSIHTIHPESMGSMWSHIYNVRE